MTTQHEVEEVRARLTAEQAALRQRIGQHNERLHRIAFAAENGSGDAIRERSEVLAERLAAKLRLEEIATALASADLHAREAQDAGHKAERETALREVAGCHEHRMRIAAKFDAALRAANEAWGEFLVSNAELSPLLARAGLAQDAGRQDAGWLLRAIWHLAPDMARHIRLAPQMRPFGQPLAVSLASRAPLPANQEAPEQEVAT